MWSGGLGGRRKSEAASFWDRGRKHHHIAYVYFLRVIGPGYEVFSCLSLPAPFPVCLWPPPPPRWMGRGAAGGVCCYGVFFIRPFWRASMVYGTLHIYICMNCSMASSEAFAQGGRLHFGRGNALVCVVYFRSCGWWLSTLSLSIPPPSRNVTSGRFRVYCMLSKRTKCRSVLSMCACLYIVCFVQ